ncbi:unnamed protein product [Hymenolepis diminuta]|uniref:Uncharacterized protein n=1 Tax=Hymenolepis diminuta TaxID=6216 RepID=A0A564Y2F7_HYMDI|nr:unnamed protein product [Hymenolepis diminuta]
MYPHNVAANNVPVSRNNQIVLLNIEVKSATTVERMEMTPRNVSQTANTTRLTQSPLRETSPVLTSALSLFLQKNAFFNPPAWSCMRQIAIFSISIHLSMLVGFPQTKTRIWQNLLTLIANSPPKHPTQLQNSIQSCSKPIHESSPKNFRNTLMIPLL